MIHIKLNVYCTEAFLPRYWREQFYQQLSAMSPEAINQPMLACTARPTHVSAGATALESSRK